MSDSAAVMFPAVRTEEVRRVRDCARLHGFTLSMRDAEAVWCEVSEAHGERWASLPSDPQALFLAILEPLHRWLAENGDPLPAAPLEAVPRPMLIDEGQDGPCEICARWAAAKYVQDADPETGRNRTRYRCDECGEIIPKMGLMGGRGFASVAPHHYHLRPVGPAQIPGRQVVLQELCPTCYREHRRKVYPNEPPEVLERRCSA